jgi:hypothetical protein
LAATKQQASITTQTLHEDNDVLYVFDAARLCASRAQRCHHHQAQ